MPEPAEQLATAARRLSRNVDALTFGAPVTHVYNPLTYAWKPFRAFLRTYANTKKRIVFLGMNPGPFGMAQTGVPFGEVSLVREWLQIEAPVGRPQNEHPKRPIHGFACTRSEVSGSRLWGAIRDHCGSPKHFFREAYIANYCPLLFMEASGRNRTPDKLAANERSELYDVCDRHLTRVVKILEPEWVVGIGAFAETRAQEVVGQRAKIGRILHPSPANPRAQKNWGGTARRELRNQGICPSL